MSIRPRWRAALVTSLVVAMVASLTLPAVAQEADEQVPAPWEQPFPDVGPTSTHVRGIATLAQAGVVGGFVDGTFRSGQPVTRGQVATFLARSATIPPVTPSFADAIGTAHEQNIGGIEQVGITSGCRDGAFCPQDQLTRGQFATLVFNMFRHRFPEVPEEPDFPDVDEDYTHREAIGALAEAGTIGGFPDGTFRPGANVTRGQIATILISLLDLDGPLPCPVARPQEPAQPVDLGLAVPAHAYTSAIRTDQTLHLFGNDFSPFRVVRVSNGQDAGSLRLPAGRRVWANVTDGTTVYAGAWGAGDGDNVFAYPANAPADAEAQALARIETGGEFWALALDDQGRLYAGTRAARNATVQAEVELGHDEHLVHRIDPAAPEGERVEILPFVAPDLPTGEDGIRPDVKQLVWHDGELFVGMGHLSGTASLYVIDTDEFDAQPEEPADPNDDAQAPRPIARDITPTTVQGAWSVNALSVDDQHVVFGSEAGGAEDVADRFLVLDRTDPTDVLVDQAMPEGERIQQVAVDAERAVGTAFPTGNVWEIDLGPGAPGEASVLATVAPLRQSRYVELREGRVNGVTGDGGIWSIDPDGQVTQTTMLGLGIPAPGGSVPHSLAAGDGRVVVGANGSVHLHGLDGSPPTRIDVPGEAKEVAETSDGELYAAIYPEGQLWRLVPGGSNVLVGDWNPLFGRPLELRIDEERGLAHVMNRSLDEPFRSAWVTIDLAVEDPEEAVIGYRRIDGQAGDPDDGEVASDTFDLTDDGGVVLADRDGFVRRLDADGEVLWNNFPGPVIATPLPVQVDIHDDTVVVTSRTRVNEFDLESGVLGRTFTPLGYTARGSVTLGPLTIPTSNQRLYALERAAERQRTFHTRPPDESFAPSPIDVDDDCVVSVFGGRRVLQVPFDPATRLPTWPLAPAS